MKSSIKPELSSSFNELVGLIRLQLSQSLKTQGYLLTPLDITTLTLIKHNSGMSLQKLVSMISKDKAQVTRKIKELEKKNLLYRQKDADDQRSYQLFLTALGKKTQIKTTAIKHKIYRQVFANLNEEEQEKMTDLLEKCLKIIVR